MREIVAYQPPLTALNLRQTLESGMTIPSLSDLLAVPYSASLCELQEDGKTVGTVIYIPAIAPEELLDSAYHAVGGDTCDGDDEDDGVDTGVDEVDDKPREIKRKVRR